MEKISFKYFQSPYGELILASIRDQLCLCDWRYRKMRTQVNNRVQKGLNAYFQEEESNTIQHAKEQLSQYFSGEREHFDISLAMVGSAFQLSVWNELVKIKYGETVTYLGLSQRLGNVKAIRAVAAANGANALSIFVPCHRVLGSQGEMTGYAGGVTVKKKLLQLESAIIIPEQLNLFE